MYALNGYSKDAPELIVSLHYFGIAPKLVYYPCSSFDYSVFKTLASSRVVYVDQDQRAVDTLISIGAEAYCASVFEFDFIQRIGRPADLLYILNPQIRVTDSFVNMCLRPGGYCICNNYHGTAEQVRDIYGMKIVGVFTQGSMRVSDFDGIWKGIVSYREQNPDSIFSPFMDSRFIFKKVQ